MSMRSLINKKEEIPEEHQMLDKKLQIYNLHNKNIAFSQLSTNTLIKFEEISK